MSFFVFFIPWCSCFLWNLITLLQRHFSFGKEIQLVVFWNDSLEKDLPIYSYCLIRLFWPMCTLFHRRGFPCYLYKWLLRSGSRGFTLPLYCFVLCVPMSSEKFHCIYCFKWLKSRLFFKCRFRLDDFRNDKKYVRRHLVLFMLIKVFLIIGEKKYLV